MDAIMTPEGNSTKLVDELPSAKSPRTTTQTRLRIGLFGNFGISNLGNECTLQALVHNIQLRQPDADLFVICTNPDDAVDRHGLPAVAINAPSTDPQNTQQPRRGLTRLLRLIFVRLPLEIRECVRAYRASGDLDLLIMSGTGMLTDQDLSPLGMPFDIFKWAVIARLRRAKVRFMGVGVGQLQTRLGRWFIHRALSLADYRSYRDLVSRERLSVSGFDVRNDQVVPDLAFSFPRKLMPEPCTRSKPLIGVGVMDVLKPITSDPHDAEIFATYLKNMAVVVAGLLDRGFSIRLLYGDAICDPPVGKLIVAELEQQGIEIGPDDIDLESVSSVEELLATLASLSLVISGRFHNLVLGLMLQKPIVAISYDPKNDALADAFGFGAYSQPIQSLDSDKLISDCVGILNESAGHGSRLHLRAEKLRTAWEEEYLVALSVKPGPRSTQFQ